MHFIDQVNYELIETIVRQVKSLPDEHRFVAIDTEFIRENVDIPVLCLVQIATRDEIYIFDTLSFDPVHLKILLEDESIKKVFHSAKQDIEMFNMHNIHLRNIYDTQINEMVLNTKEYISYKDIVWKYLGHKIKKDYLMSNWFKRPLSKKQLQYCANDVSHLVCVYEKQYEQLERLGRVNWTDQEHNLLLLRETEDKLIAKETDAKSVILQKLIEWRSQLAEKYGVSITDIASDRIIKSISKKGLAFIRILQNSRGTKDKYLKEFLYKIEKESDKLDFKVNCDTKGDIVLVKMLKAILYECAYREQIAPVMLATTDELDDLVRGITDVRCLNGWRKDVFGDVATKFLLGDLSISLCNKRVVFG